MSRRAELGQFLRSRRARLSPADLGLTTTHNQRRVPGLRREEVARLAGVSVDHYGRLEQGRDLGFSTAVLDAVARVLRLDADERAHLYRLVRPEPGREGTVEQRVGPGLRRLVESATDVPAYVVGRRGDVLAWNRLAAALITDFGALPAAERNIARVVFGDPAMRRRYADWLGKAGDVVAYLRLDLGRHPEDPKLAQLVRELSAASPEFRGLWADHRVGDKTRGAYRFTHPVAGELDLAYETLRPPDDPDQALITYVVEPGSPSEAALRLL